MHKEKLTPHNEGCKRVFKRYDSDCPRCQELINGAEARKGWGWHKKEEEARRSAAIKNHDCKKSNCGIVCTAFEW